MFVSRNNDRATFRPPSEPTRDVAISQDNLRPSQRQGALLARHASDHNCALKPKQHSYLIRKRRTQEISERRVRDIKDVKQGKMSEEIVNRGLSHDAVFMCPVPFVGWQPAADCLSVSGARKGNDTLQRQQRARSQ